MLFLLSPAKSLDAGTPGSIAGDPAMLRILIDNLIDNALKYGRSGGTIEVRIRPDESGPVLTVVDDGEGVSAADLARLHDRFFRIEGTSASGSGLGLSIVEKIAAAHHAKVEFHSGIGGRGLGVSVRFGEA